MKPSPLLVPEGRSTHKNGYLLGNIEAQCADESSNAAHRNSGKYSLLSPFQADRNAKIYQFERAALASQAWSISN